MIISKPATAAEGPAGGRFTGKDGRITRRESGARSAPRRGVRRRGVRRRGRQVEPNAWSQRARAGERQVLVVSASKRSNNR